MTNLSEKKRQRMLDFLDTLKAKKKDDDKTLIAINEIENTLNEKKYGLVWEQHEEAVDVEMQTHIPVFTENKDREITAAPGEAYNFLLEGDNLHSLRLLEKTHKGKIDVIYIDPPYNTGKKDDFIYNDIYVDKDDAFRHSKWLSFMSKRLKIARNLLSERGVIFIQISDIELAQLKCLCDEIYGESNFLNIVNVNMKNIAGASGGGEDKKLKKNCEYILIYAKNYDLLPIFTGTYDYEEISNLVSRYKEEGISWKYTSLFLNPGIKKYITSTVDGDGNEIKIFKQLNYQIKSIHQLAKDENITEKEVYYKYANRIIRTTMPQSSIRPRVMEKLMSIGYDNDLISIEYIPKTGRNKGTVYTQYYKGSKYNLFAWLSDVLERKGDEYYKKTLQGTYWDFTAGTKNLSKEGNIIFPNGKKPVALIKRIISLYPASDITVLDFFAGSGTTAQAVMELNKEDQGNRRFILCTNNENDICDKITYKRICNVISGYRKVNAIPTNLKYYRTDFVSKDEEFLSDVLLEHVTEMIQLEHGIKLDGEQYIMVMSDEEADKLEAHWDEYPDVKALYVSGNVLFTTEQKRLFNDIEIYIIPDYYFDFEMREVGESW